MMDRADILRDFKNNHIKRFVDKHRSLIPEMESGEFSEESQSILQKYMSDGPAIITVALCAGFYAPLKSPLFEWAKSLLEKRISTLHDEGEGVSETLRALIETYLNKKPEVLTELLNKIHQESFIRHQVSNRDAFFIDGSEVPLIN